MALKTAHEPNAEVMSAEDVWGDAQQIAATLRKNLLKAEPSVKLQIPLSVFLEALDNFNRDELVVVSKRIKERLAA